MSPRFRRVLWLALAINAAMFIVEILGGVVSGSISLLADAVDFAGDAATYGLTLAVLSMGLLWRARAALVKGLAMGGYGLFIVGKTGWALAFGTPPEAVTMGAIGVLALIANLSVAAMLYTYRDGDANMRSVWLCTRNDVIVNIAIVLAALGVHETSAAWPDLLVAGLIAALALSSSASVIRQARREIDIARRDGAAKLDDDPRARQA